MLKYMADELAAYFNDLMQRKYPGKGYLYAAQFPDESDQSWVLDMFISARDARQGSRFFGFLGAGR